MINGCIFQFQYILNVTSLSDLSSLSLVEYQVVLHSIFHIFLFRQLNANISLFAVTHGIQFSEWIGLDPFA